MRGSLKNDAAEKDLQSSPSHKETPVPAPFDGAFSGRPARFLLPSITDLIFILLFFSLAFGVLAPRLLWDGDIGWHIRDGQNILATHSVPRVDSFSATRTGHPWYAWEWLYDVMIGVIYNRMGLNGVVLFSAAVIATTLASVFRLALIRGGKLLPTVGLFLVGTVASSIHFLARPHVVGWLMTILWLNILDASYRKALIGQFDRRLYWLPALMLLWANLHGGFVLGFVLLGIYLAADGLHWSKCRTEQRTWAAKHARELTLAFLVSAVASLVNPYGYKLHSHVYQYLTDRFLMQHIDEFRAPNLHGLPTQAFLVLLLLALGAVASARAKMRWADALLILFAAGSGLFAARNIPVASMLLIIVTAPLWSKSREKSWASSRSQFLDRINVTERHLRGHVWPILILFASLLICLNQGRLCGRRLMDSHFDERRFPVAAVDFLQQSAIRMPVFSFDSWGGYLIYRLYPETKVFIDDRHDFYGDAMLREYLKVLHVESGWSEVLDRWNVNVIMLPSACNLAKALRQLNGWGISYEDSVAIVFARRQR